MARARTQLERDAAQLVKYEEWIAELEKRQAELDRGRPFYLKCFYALPFVSLVGFAVSVGVGAGSLFTAVLMTVFGLYTVRVRASDYRTNLEGSRAQAAKLRASIEARTADAATSDPR